MAVLATLVAAWPLLLAAWCLIGARPGQSQQRRDVSAPTSEPREDDGLRAEIALTRQLLSGTISGDAYRRAVEALSAKLDL